jgi:GLPGLI family protein
MKTYLMSILVLLSTTKLLAQKVITDATIVYDITVVTGNKTVEIGDAFDGATTTVYMKGMQSRSEMSSSLLAKTTIFDGRGNTATVLTESGGEKYMTNYTADSWKTMNAKFDSSTYTVTDETKTILGYACKKAIVKLKSGAEFVVYFTTELEAASKEYNPMFRGLGGFPLQYESQLGKKKVTFTASKINFNAVPTSKFDLPKSGYKVLSA